jgi:quinol monooxygenase YgiN
VKVAQIARMVAKPGRRDELVAALEPAFEKAEQEAGTEVHMMLLDARTLRKVLRPGGSTEVAVEEHPDEVWFFELYRDAEALRAHEEGYALNDAVRSIAPKLMEILAEPPTIVQASPAREKAPAPGR